MGKILTKLIIELQKRKFISPNLRRRVLSLTKEIDVGKETVLQEAIHYSGYVSIGDNCFVNRGCTFQGGISKDDSIILGNNIFIGCNTIIATGTHDIGDSWRRAKPGYYKPVYVGDGCWIGAGVILLPGIKVGKGSVIGAGAVVATDIPENVLAVGVPCKVIKSLPEKMN